MAINETISTGNKYRRLKDATNKVWQRLSFWTKASDVEFDNGTTAQASLGNITGITDSVNSNSSTVAASANAVYTLNSNLANFQHGVDALYNQIASLGVTPSGKTLDAIKNAISTVKNNAYNSGKNDGYNSGYSAGAASGKKVIDLGSATSFNVQAVCSSYGINPGNLSASNFICEPETYGMNVPIPYYNSVSGHFYAKASVTLNKSYSSPTLTAYYRADGTHYGSDVETKSDGQTYNAHAYLVV